jgi:hypothetical protein
MRDNIIFRKFSIVMLVLSNSNVKYYYGNKSAVAAYD